MEENKTPASFWSKKNIVIIAGVAVLTVALYMLGSGTFFKASLLDMSQVPAFDGTVRPIAKTLKWTALTSKQFQDFKSGALTFDNAGDVLIDLPSYNADALCNPASDPDSQNAFKTYVTAYMGKYTSGVDPACENAGSHVAVDIRAAKLTPVFSIANGIVSKKKTDSSNGNVVCITHPNVPSLEDQNTRTDYVSCYLHMDSIQGGIDVGTVVTKRQQIGVVGTTGTSTTYHLHFQLDKKTAPFSPYWPFTSQQAKDAGCDFFSCVNQGVGQESGLANTVNPMKWVQQYLNFGESVSAGTPDVTPKVATTTTTTTNSTTTSDEKKNENTQPANPNTNTLGTTTNPNTNTTSSSSSSGGNTSSGATGSFPDVPADHPYAKDIEYVKANGIVSGYSNGNYGPEDALSRGALAKIIANTRFPGATPSNPACFSDSKGDWWDSFACILKEKEVISGYPDGSFKGANLVTASESAKFIAAAFNLPTTPSDPWFKTYLEAMGTKNAIPASINSVSSQVNRGEFAAMIHRLNASIIDQPSKQYSDLSQ